MDKSPRPYIAYILEILQIIKDNTPADKATFIADLNARDATLMRLQDIGEQLSHLREVFPDFYESYQTDGWHELIGLRNIISHGYREIDFEIIWFILNKKLPGFTEHMQAVTKEI
jgi:uncharacterized protein with HEPN domain